MKNFKMVTPKKWDDLRAAGLLFFANQVLHVFGWAIVVELYEKGKNKGKVKSAYPARVKFRGFSNEVQEEQHKKIGTYLKRNASILQKETQLP